MCVCVTPQKKLGIEAGYLKLHWNTPCNREGLASRESRTCFLGARSMFGFGSALPRPKLAPYPERYAFGETEILPFPNFKMIFWAIEISSLFLIILGAIEISPLFG